MWSLYIRGGKVKVLDVFFKNLRIFLKNIFRRVGKWLWLHANEVSDAMLRKVGPMGAEATLAAMPKLRE